MRLIPAELLKRKSSLPLRNKFSSISSCNHRVTTFSLPCFQPVLLLLLCSLQRNHHQNQTNKRIKNYGLKLVQKQFIKQMIKTIPGHLIFTVTLHKVIFLTLISKMSGCAVSLQSPAPIVLHHMWC